MGNANLPSALQASAKANFNSALDYIYEVQVSSSKATIQTTYSQALNGSLVTHCFARIVSIPITLKSTNNSIKRPATLTAFTVESNLYLLLSQSF
jgi:hypothetical protein